MREDVVNGSLGRRKGGFPVGIDAVAAVEELCGAGRVVGMRVCEEVCLAESSQPAKAKAIAATNTAPLSKSRVACRYVKSGGPQPDYGKERAGTGSTG